MVVKKTLGIVLGCLGAIGIAAWSFPSMQASISNMPEIIQVIGGETNLMIASLALVIIGVLLAFKGGRGRQKGAEVPIYHGRNIVGYRRS